MATEEVMTSDEIRQKLEDFGPVRWVEALRSGRYTHHQGALGYYPETGDGELHGNKIRACCLGALVEAAGVARRHHTAIGVGEIYRSSGDIPNDCLPTWLGANPYGDTDEPCQEDLIQLNDADGVSDYEAQIRYIEERIIPGWQANVTP